MRVGRIQPAEEDLLRVVLIVAVGVLQEHQIRRLCEDHAAIPELETSGVVEVAGEHGPSVGLAIAIRVFEDQQFVIHPRLGLPMRVVLPGGDPKPASGIEGELNGVHQFRELLLRREQLHLQTGPRFHLLHGGVRAQVGVRAVGALARLVGARIDECRGRGVSGCQFRRARREAASDTPDLTIPVRGHAVEHFDLALQDLVVGWQKIVLVEFDARGIHVSRIGANEREKGAIAERREGVRRPVAVEPEEVLVRNRPLQRREIRGGVRARRRAEQLAIDDLGEAPVAFFVEVHAVDRQVSFRRRVEIFGRTEQVDELNPAGRSYLGHCQRVLLEASVVLAPVRQIRVAQVFVRNRREQDDPRRRRAVVALSQRVGDPLFELLAKCRQPGLAAEGFAVTEERKDDVRLGVRPFQPVLLVSTNRSRVSAQPLVWRAEVLGSQPRGNFVPAEPEVPNDEIVPRKSRVQHRLEPPVVLQPLCEHVPDDRNVIVLSKLEGRRRLPGRSQHRERSEHRESNTHRPAPACLRHATFLASESTNPIPTRPPVSCP